MKVSNKTQQILNSGRYNNPLQDSKDSFLKNFITRLTRVLRFYLKSYGIKMKTQEKKKLYNNTILIYTGKNRTSKILYNTHKI